MALPTLKQQMIDDVASVFLNEDNFAEWAAFSEDGQAPVNRLVVPETSSSGSPFGDNWGKSAPKDIVLSMAVDATNGIEVVIPERTRVTVRGVDYLVMAILDEDLGMRRISCSKKTQTEQSSPNYVGG